MVLVKGSAETVRVCRTVVVEGSAVLMDVEVTTEVSVTVFFPLETVIVW